MKDLREKKLRACSKNSFREDPIRLWRAHRQAVQLGLTIDPGTAKLIKRDARLVAKAGGERLRDELFKLLAAPGAARALAAARVSGVLLASLPELKPMQAVRLKGIKPIDVLAHTLDAIAQLEPVIKALPRSSPLDHAEIAAHLMEELVPGRPRRALLGLAVLLHDIAKPATASLNEEGDVHFFQHESVGAKAATALMRKTLKCAEAEVAAVARLITLHLRPGYLASQQQASDKAAYRLIRDAGEEVLELVVHAQADRLATRHGLKITARRHRAMVDRILGLRRAMRDRQPAVKYLDGHTLMQALKLKPGPVVGELLRAVDEAVALGRVKDREGALGVARKALDLQRKRVI
jgi:tRNA nucleotidyltransferase/poly(A) polymerase